MESVFRLLVCVALATSWDAAAAQGGPPRGASAAVLAGSVVDAETGEGLPGVTVTLEPVPSGMLPSRRPGDSPFLQATRSTTSSASGEYTFRDLAAGSYRLRFVRTGYRATSLEVALQGSAGSRISVGLEVEPVVLEPLTVTTPEPDPFGVPSAAGTRDRRVAAEQLRQERYLASDVRGLTHADVMESVTLGETDLFRSLQRLPGVSGSSIWSSELWTRGAPWDQTRAYFDGLPLFSPTHGMGMFSGVNADALGAAFLHPGVQPVTLGGGAAGTLDLRSRRGAGDADGSVRGAGELSLISGRVALDQQRSDGRAAWMFAGRRTYLDLITGAIQGIAGGEDIHVPYDFYDTVVRTDLDLSGGRFLELSTLLTLDQVTGDIPDVLHRSRLHWGGGAARATLATPLFGLESRHTLGVSGFGSRSSTVEPDTTLERLYGAPSVTPTSNDLYYLSLAGEVSPAATGGAVPGWRAGYELVSERVTYWGPQPLPYETPRPRSTRWEAELARASLWGSRRWSPDQRLTVDAGVRVDAGPAVRGSGALRPAPRLSARFQLSPEVSLSAAAGRIYQYEHALARGGASPIAGFSSEYLWTLANDSTPAMRSDHGTLGAEWWLSDRWLASANAYLRDTRGVMVPNPTPGVLLRDLPIFVPADSRSRGMELSLRRLAGRWTASAAYTLAETEVEAEGHRYPAPGDRRHEMDATAMVRLGGAWRVGAAYSGASGSPFTRVVQGSATCERWNPATQKLEPLPECEWSPAPRAEEPGAQRNDAQHRLDLLVAWGRSFRRWEMSAYLQVHSALNQGWERAGGYTHSYPICNSGRNGEECTVYDEFVTGAPVLPVLGVRVTF